jgi:hypothetical protein
VLTITDEDLLRFAGQRSFDRGVAYAREGRVRLTKHTEHELAGIVRGSARYSCRIVSREDESIARCDCPVAAEEDWCKHTVALAIAVRQEGSVSSTDELFEFLSKQPAERLVQWLLEFAHEHHEIERVLELRRAEADPALLRKSLQQLLKTGTYLDWKQSIAFARRLDMALDALRSLDPGTQESFEQMEWLLLRLLKIYSRSDDSSGAIGERIHRVADMYIEALTASVAPRPRSWAAMLLQLKREDEWGFLPLGAIWSALTEPVQDAYAALVEKNTAASAHVDYGGDPMPGAALAEELYTVRGDLEALVAFLARDLSSEWSYERIVAVYREAGRLREAVQWAERACKAFRKTPRLKNVLADLYLEEGFTEDSLRLCEEAFAAQPTTTAWDRLKRSAGAQWPAVRRNALEIVARRERIIDGTCDATFTAELLLHDGDIDGAIQLAREHLLQSHLLTQLAATVATRDSQSAAQFMRRAVEAQLPTASTPHYSAVVHDIAACLKWDPETARPWIAELRSRYKARRKFIRLLDSVQS